MYRFLLLIITFLAAQNSVIFSQCTSFSGTIRQGSQLSCGENEAQALPDSLFANTFSNIFLNDEVLDDNDTLLFFLTDRAGLPGGTIHGQTGKGQRMLIDLPVELDSFYRIYAVVGDKDGMGGIDFSDPCLSISGSWSLRFSVEPPEVQSIQPILELSCLGRLEFDAASFVFDPTINWDYFWTTGDIGPVGVFTEPGFYSVDISHPDYICPAIRGVQVLPFREPNISFNIPDSISCNNATAQLLALFPPGLIIYEFNWLNPAGDVIAQDTNQWEVSTPGVYQLELRYEHASNDTCLLYYDLEVPQSSDGCALIKGTIHRDTTGDCLPDALEPVLSERIVRFQGSQTRYAISNLDGEYQFYYPANQGLELEIVSDHLLYENCNGALPITAPDVGDTLVVDLSQRTVEDCPLLEVKLTSGRHRRCSPVRFDIEWCNKGTNKAPNAYIQLRLDPFFILVTASLPYTAIGGGLYEFQIFDVPQDSCGSFFAYADLDCQATLGATLCSDVQIFPNDPCPSPNAQWSGASVAVKGTCQDTTISFTIKNEGSGNMQVPGQYIVIEDGVMLYPNPVPFQLDALDSIELAFSANGKTYRLEAEQAPNHPGFSMPSFTVEGCSTYGSQGYLNQFPQNDVDPFIDISCREVIGSYDPNNKLAFPTGYSAEHFIEEDQMLEYLIQFQNTGTDTAFFVMVEDALDPNLDIETFRPLQASHNYRIDIGSQDTIRFIFEDIQLPDSTTDLLNSQGYIRFQIAPIPNIALGTVIRNDVDIFFDQNDPIRTNEVFHTIGRDFILTDTYEHRPSPIQMVAYPNPVTDSWYLDLQSLTPISESLKLTISDMRGSIILQNQIHHLNTKLDLSQLPDGAYFWQVSQQDGILKSGKIIKM